jgi:hypothetical protein
MARFRTYIVAFVLILPIGCHQSPSPVVVTTPDRPTLESQVGKWVRLQGLVHGPYSQGRLVLVTSGEPVLLDSWRGVKWTADGRQEQFTGILRSLDGPPQKAEKLELRFRLEQPEPLIDFEGLKYSILGSLLGSVCLWSLLLGALWVWTCIAMKPPVHGSRWRVFLLGCLPPFAIPIAIFTVSIMFAVDPRHNGGVPTYPVHILNGLLAAQLPLAGFLLYPWRRQWLSILTSSLFAGYLALVGNFYGTMMVTGRWL